MEQTEGADFPPKSQPPQEQSEVSSSPTAAAAPDIPVRKLVRQLDFTGLTGGGASSSSTAEQQPELPKLPSQPIKQPPSLPQQHQTLFVTMQPPSQAASVPPVIRPLVKPESPKARPRANVTDPKEGTPKKQKQCNCKHSRCLKLYCECFASGIYCDGCNCVNCHNNVENEPARREAVEATLERNPHAFRPKIASSPHGARDNREEAGEVVVAAKHNKGCHCKKSGCLKKYCECFQANILCSENCKCMDCKNYEGSEERQALFHGDNAHNIAFIQQAANAAITGAIGSSGYGSPPLNKKRKGQDLYFGSTAKDAGMKVGHLQLDNQNKASAPSSSSTVVPGGRPGNMSALGPSKFTYRSLLADIIQPRDLKELCSVLVVYSGEAAKLLAEEKNAAEKRAEDSKDTSAAPSTEEQFQSQKQSADDKAPSDSLPEEYPTEKAKADDTASDGADVSKNRPMSPSTLALMCDEQDTMFSPAGCINGLPTDSNSLSQLPQEQGPTEVYVEQERIVLTKFRDCLNRLITLGDIKETKYSSMEPTEFGNGRDFASNGASNVRTQQQQSMGNGIPKMNVLPQHRMSPVISQAGGRVVHNVNSQKISKHPENGDVTKTEKDL